MLYKGKNTAPNIKLVIIKIFRQIFFINILFDLSMIIITY